MMASCETIIDLEDPPKGQITLTTDWTERTTDIEIPSDYTVIINNQTLTFSNITNPLPELEAGIYPVHIYNTPDKISINGTTATVSATNGNIDPLPGWLFTAISEVQYADYKVETVTARMQQQVRQLTLTLKPEGGTVDRIESITGNLSGIAGSWDFKENRSTGNAVNIPLVFVKQTDGTWQVTVRLLGITGMQQKLTGKITFTDGSPGDMTLDSDLSSSLTAFNTDKKTPLALKGDMEETTSEAGFSGTINKWQAAPDSGGIAW